ncbi:MAG TPA: hypothetical protein QGG37_06350 [Chloroflexota bacterium]|nr:hypothetical protein [Chloroflexota bacterium]
METNDLPRRRLFQAAVVVGAGELLEPGSDANPGRIFALPPDEQPAVEAHAGVLDASGTWGDLGLYFAERLGTFGRSTWYDADWGRVIDVRRQSGELSDAYTAHPSAWYAAVHDRSWIGDRLVGVNPETRRYVVADIIDVVASPQAVVDWSSAAFAELGTPLSRGVQNVWIVRVPG